MKKNGNMTKFMTFKVTVSFIVGLTLFITQKVTGSIELTVTYFMTPKVTGQSLWPLGHKVGHGDL